MNPFDLRNWKGFAEAGGDSGSPAIVDQIVIDSRRVDSPNALFVPLKGSNLDGHHFVRHAIERGARYALVKRDWEQNPNGIILLRVPDPLKAFQEIAGAYRQQLKAKVIAITGTHGKTMVKDLLQAMLSVEKSTAASPESFNSQVGVPLSLFTIRQEHDVALIEAAASQTQEMDALAAMIRPDHSILTHIGKNI